MGDLRCTECEATFTLEEVEGCERLSRLRNPLRNPCRLLRPSIRTFGVLGGGPEGESLPTTGMRRTLAAIVRRIRRQTSRSSSLTVSGPISGLQITINVHELRILAMWSARISKLVSIPGKASATDPIPPEGWDEE